MVLVDTSVWIDHLRSDDEQLSHLLEQGQVHMHPMILGELACGNLQNRPHLLGLWERLPFAVEATHTEALHCLEKNRLMGRGIGYIDLHLLASVLLSPDTVLWTRDHRLQQIASDLGVGLSLS